MKSKTSRVLLLSENDTAKEKQIRTLCARMEIQVIRLQPADMNKRVGELAGILPVALQKISAVPTALFQMPELMIFSGFTKDFLDHFLDSYTAEGIPAIPLKAMLTPYNISWSLQQLITELIRERTEIMMRQK